MNIRRLPRQLAEGLLVCAGYVLFPFLPRACVVRLARLLGNAAYLCSQRLRSVALANLDLAYGTSLTIERKQTIARQAFGTMALVMIDLFWFGCFPARRFRTWVRVDESVEPYFQPGPVIAVTGHLGNWEVLGHAAALRGRPPLSVAAPLSNGFADKVLNRSRRATGQRVVSKKGAVRELLRTLRDGGSVALVMDQNTLPRDGGEFVPFFGLPAPFSKAVTAVRERVPSLVMFATCISDEHGVYTVRAFPICSPQEQTCPDLTARVAAALEKQVRANPGAWLWMYKRWKFIAPGQKAGDYPFYARRATENDSNT